MNTLDFEMLMRDNPEKVSQSLLIAFDARGWAGVDIDPTAQFHLDVSGIRAKKIGARCVVGEGSLLENDVVVEDDVWVDDFVTVRRNTFLGQSVVLSSDFKIEGNGYFAQGASVDALTATRKHPYLRLINEWVIVGEGVALPSEVQLGHDAVIPTQDCIAQIGRFGTSKRMVTIYGSEYGPLYGVGCQYGIDTITFKKRVASNTETTSLSAADYARHMDEFEELGKRVQAAYEKEDNHKQELLDQRRQTFAAAGLL